MATDVHVCVCFSVSVTLFSRRACLGVSVCCVSRAFPFAFFCNPVGGVSACVFFRVQRACFCAASQPPPCTSCAAWLDSRIRICMASGIPSPFISCVCVLFCVCNGACTLGNSAWQLTTARGCLRLLPRLVAVAARFLLRLPLHCWLLLVVPKAVLRKTVAENCFTPPLFRNLYSRGD